MSNKFRKLTLQYAYLKLEKDEVDEICLLVEKEIRIYMEKHYPEGYKSIYESPAAPPDIKTKQEEEQGGEEHAVKAAAPKSKDLRKLYRKIAEKTHPDKVGNNTKRELFSKAANAYAENDIGKLLEIAGELNIELLELSPESILLLESNIEILSSGIVNKKKTTGWSWHCAKSQEEKESIVQAILKMKGIKI